MPSYILPQVLVYQEFERAPASLSQPLRACIIGEHFDLHRYSDVDEKAAIGVGEYDSTAETCYLWPGRQAGAVVDQTYSKVFIDDALLNYFNDDTSSLLTEIKAVTALTSGVKAAKNRIRAENHVWKTLNGVTRETSLLRDVKAGDAVKLVTAYSCGSPATFETSVAGFVADKVPAVTAAAESDADNQTATVAGSSNAQTAGSSNNLEIASTDHSTYDALEDGNPAEVYTVEVVTAGAPGVAVFRVTSASGDDNSGLVTSEALGLPVDIGTRGLTATFDDTGVGVATPQDVFILGQTWEITVAQTFVVPTPTSSGTYTGTQDTTYIVTVSRGGKYVSALKPQITVSTTTGVDVSGPTDITAAATAVAVGSKGVLVAFNQTGLCDGDKFTIEVTAEADGAVRTLVLSQNLPEGFRGVCPDAVTTVTTGDIAITNPNVTNIPTTAAMFAGMSITGVGIPANTYVISITSATALVMSANATATTVGVAITVGASIIVPDLDVTLYIKKNIEVPELAAAAVENWTQSTTELCLQPAIEGYDSEWVDAGVLQPLLVEGGTVYIEHRDRLSAHVGIVETISSITDVEAALGVVHHDNPLAFGVYKALLNSNGEEVKYTAVGDTATLEDWLEALDALVGRDDVYSIVPLTYSKDVLDAVEAHCDSESTPENGRWRICWLNQEATEEIEIYVETEDEDPVLATIIDDPDTSGTQYTLVEVVGGQFVTKGVRAGDTVRAEYTTDGFGNVVYSEFVVDTVVNEETLLLATGVSLPVNIAAKIEIHRTLTKTELAAAMALKPGLFSNRRAFLVWPDVVGNAGASFPGYFLCAGLAGLRSGVLPHQGLTNVEIAGFDDVDRAVTYFTASQLNTMAASGYWIVTQDPSDGTIYTRHQLSTGDQTDLNFKEQSITTNLDHISYIFLFRLKSYIGKGNVTPTMINILRGEIISVLEEFKNNISVDRLGAQLNDGVITELRQHPTFKDRVLCRVNLDLPYPLNNVELHLIA